jgi:phenylalanyl-tRNA synthetase beta chain
MRYRNIDRLIGKRIDRSTMEDILNRLDIKLLDKTAEGFVAVVPPYRVDVTREADVVEELLRIYGYDNIPLQTQTATDFLAEFPEIDPDAEQLKTSELLTGEGYYEIITNSLTKPEYAQQAPFLDADRSVHMINKLSEDLAVLRQSLLFTGLEVIRYNISHRQKNVRLFEFGKSYHRDKSGYIEKSMLSIWATGNYTSESWLTENRPLHFHDFFGVVLKIINKFIQGRSRHEIFEHPAFEYCLKLTHDSQDVSIAGLLSQDTTRLVDLREEIFYAEIDFKWLIENGQTRFSMREIPKFPEVRRDLSLVIDRGVTFEEIRGIAQEKEFEGVLKDVNVFDYYEGESLGKDKKAYALSFILQDDKKTLTDKDIDRTMERLMRLYETKIGAIIRK